MGNNSRTSKSVRNSASALVFFCINLFLQFYSRKIFLDVLGTEILGLNSTATNILQFLNLAELGIGAAVGSYLYKPLFDGDKEKIREIITLQGIIYRRIGIAILAVGGIVSLFFPLIFAKTDLPLWYAYASFGVLLLGSILGYFVNYRQILLTSDLKDYKIQFSYKLCMALKVVAQTIAVAFAPHPYVWWLVIEGLFAVIGSAWLEIVTRRTYPYLRNVKAGYKELAQRHSDIILRTKQLFFQKIASFVLFQTSPLIIFAYMSLTIVALYGNYMLVITGVISLLAAVFNSMIAGIGNLVAEGNREHTYKVFFELFSLRFLIVTTLCFAVLVTGQPFIISWVGEEYLLPFPVLALLTAILYTYLSRYLVNDYLAAYGWFGDVWASIAEVVANVGGSIILGYYFGLEGIVGGVLIALVLFSAIWKPIYLFHYKLKAYGKRYICQYLLHIAIGAPLFGACAMAAISRSAEASNSMRATILFGTAWTALYALACATALFIFVPSFRDVARRFIPNLKKKKEAL